MKKNNFIEIFVAPVFYCFWGSSIKVDIKVVAINIAQSLKPISQTIFWKLFGLFVRSTSNKVLFRFVHVGTFTKFVRLYMSLRAEKLSLGSPLESNKSLFKSPARKIFSYLFNTWFKLFEFLGEIKRCFV